MCHCQAFSTSDAIRVAGSSTYTSPRLCNVSTPQEPGSLQRESVSLPGFSNPPCDTCRRLFHLDFPSTLQRFDTTRARESPAGECVTARLSPLLMRYVSQALPLILPLDFATFRHHKSQGVSSGRVCHCQAFSTSDAIRVAGSSTYTSPRLCNVSTPQEPGSLQRRVCHCQAFSTSDAIRVAGSSTYTSPRLCNVSTPQEPGSLQRESVSLPGFLHF